MSQAIDAILVPTDGSEQAEAGARCGIGIADTAGAALHVLSVVETREIEPALSDLDTADRADRERQFEDGAERSADAVAGLAREQLSGRVTTAVEHGVPFRAISEYVETHDIDLVVMGTQGRSGLERLLLGSVAEKTLRTVSVPVVAVPPSATEIELSEAAYDDILLPTDGSSGAEIATDWAVTLAELYDSTVHTVYSVDESRFVTDDGSGGIHDELERTGRDALGSVREHAGSNDVSVVGYLGRGPAARVILDYSDEHDIDMIVMGTHGRSGIDRYLVGSVTETVVRGAAVPVCCVPMEGI
jgi:nucleotide-binding universal stress UspA family protein